MDGWIKSWRKILDSRVFRNPELLKVWVWCLHKASHKKRWVPIKTGRGETEVEIQPGQFIFGRFKAAKELAMKPSSAHDRMKKLATLGNLTLKPGTHFSVVTICNWERYQGDQPEKQHPTRQASNTQATGKQQASNTDKKVEKGKKEKKEEEEEADPLFDRFWAAYPRKISKKPAHKAWKAIFKNGQSPDPDAIIGAVGPWTRQWTLMEKRPLDRIPYPASWLNANGWEDELPGPDPNIKPHERILTDADHLAGW